MGKSKKHKKKLRLLKIPATLELKDGLKFLATPFWDGSRWMVMLPNKRIVKVFGWTERKHWEDGMETGLKTWLDSGKGEWLAVSW